MVQWARQRAGRFPRSRELPQMTPDQLRELFPRPVALCSATAENVVRLHPEEEALVAGAVARRRREFALGRHCARTALRELGAADAPLLRAPQGQPRWPEGFVGSITHCDGYCGAMVARRADVVSLGFDAEGAAPLDAALARMVCRPEEFEAHQVLGAPRGSNWAKLAFSAKEAFYKCYHPLTGAFLEFSDVAVRFMAADDLRHGTFQVALRNASRPRPARDEAFRGAWRLDATRIYCAVTLSAEAPELAP